MKTIFLLLLLIPNLVMAGICFVYVEVEQGDLGIIYTSDIKQKLDAKKCKKKDILYATYTFADVNPRAVADSIFQVMAHNCNISKSIEYDLLTGHLVCEYRRNSAGANL